MEERNPYEIVGSHNQGARNEQRGYSKSKLYMVPNAAQYDDENQYEELQISTLPPSEKQTPSAQLASQGLNNRLGTSSGTNDRNKDTKTRRSRGCIAICMLLTVLAVITLTALAVGVLGFKESSNAQLAIDALAETQPSYTYLTEEISALKSLLVQLNSDTQKNISQLDSRMRQDVNTAQQSINAIRGSQSSIWRSYSTVSNRVNTISSSVTVLYSTASHLSTSVSRLSNSANSASSSISRLSYTSVSRLSSSATQLSISASSVSFTVSQLSYSASRNSYSISRFSYYSISRLSTSVSSIRYYSISRISTSIRSLSLSVSRLSTSITRCTRC